VLKSCTGKARRTLSANFVFTPPPPKKTWNFGIFLECPCKSKCYNAKKLQMGKKVPNMILEFNLNLSFLRILNDA